MTRRGCALVFVFLFLGSSVIAQSQPAVTPEMRAAASEAYQKQDWKAAAANYGKIIQLEPANAGARYRHGMSLMNMNMNMNMNDGARASLANAFAASPNPIFGLALARAYARLSMPDKMYEVLEKSFTLGGIAPASLTGEADFAASRNDPRFLDMVRRSDLAVNPCKAAPEFRQFDFWIGEWDPRNAQGITVGSSSIQLILGECVILENWSTPVSSGKSFNIYNTADKRWHQTWVDDKGHGCPLCGRSGRWKDGARLGIRAERAENYWKNDVLETRQR